MIFFPALFLIFSVLAKILAGNSFSDNTYLVTSGTLKLNSNSQLSCTVIAV